MAYTEDIVTELNLEFPNEKFLFVRFEPMMLDFLKPFKGIMIVNSSSKEVRINFNDLQLNRGVRSILSPVFSKGRTVLTWDIKQFFTYIKKHLPELDKKVECRIVDLKYGSLFYGNRYAKEPGSFSEAVKLAKTFVSDTKWYDINQKIYVPLATEVLPRIETLGVINSETGSVLYSSYEIEAQTNGRLSTHKISDRYAFPHSMGPEQKALLLLRSEEYESRVFGYFDYNHMEVSMLQWLTKDNVHGDILNDGKDFYASLHQLIFKSPCDTEEKRRLVKGFFLPIMYGLQSSNLSKKLKISQSDAEDIISIQNKTFKTATEWLASKQNDVKNNPIAIDYFGRRRDFTDEPSHKRRNFEIQAPGAMICLERLCHLSKSFQDCLVFHIHDGYVLTLPNKDALDKVSEIKSVLESPSPLAEGLSLRISAEIGSRLDSLNKV